MEITIHRALSQLKTTQARIEDKLEKDLYIDDWQDQYGRRASGRCCQTRDPREL